MRSPSWQGKSWLQELGTAVTHLVSTVGKQTEKCWLSSFLLLFSPNPQSLGHGAAHSEAVSPSANPTQEFPHRPTPTFVSWVILDHITVTTATNSYPILSVVVPVLPLNVIHIHPVFFILSGTPNQGPFNLSLALWCESYLQFLPYSQGFLPS